MEHMENADKLRAWMAAVIFAGKQEGRLDSRIIESVMEVDALLSALQDIGPVKAREMAYRQARGLPPESWYAIPERPQQAAAGQYGGAGKPEIGLDENGDAYMF